MDRDQANAAQQVSRPEAIRQALVALKKSGAFDPTE